MTDIKATPATDQEIEAFLPQSTPRRQREWWSIKARIAADAEIIKAKDAQIETILKNDGAKIDELCHERNVRQKICAERAEEIERLKAQVQVGHDVIRDFDAKIDEARDQVRGLREALKLALDHCDCSDYRGMALIPCTEANPCAGCYTMRTGQSALAATEPKG